MLSELAVRNLGIIKDMSLQFSNNMTALTGETGAGKTLITEAVSLLLGGRADSVLVGPWAEEAEVEGRFVLDAPTGVLDGDFELLSEATPSNRETNEAISKQASGNDEANDNEEASEEAKGIRAEEISEIIIRRVVARKGRSRAYINGKLAATKSLAETAEHLVDLHGQHLHQSLLRPASQRAALDSFGNVETAPLREARARIRALKSKLDTLGGDEHARQRTLDMLRHQLDEISAARLSDPSEDEQLQAEEKLLAEAGESQAAVQQAAHITSGDGAATTALAEALALIDPYESLAEPATRLRRLSEELAEAGTELRFLSEELEADPARLEEIVERRSLLADLRRKYGSTLAEVMEYAERSGEELEELESTEERTAEIRTEIAKLEAQERKIAAEVGAARRQAATRLTEEITSFLSQLAMPNARFVVEVGEDPGEAVEFLLSANPPLPPSPLRKVVSGGELSRVTLAIQLVSRQAPPTVVFDEVDAGVGGTAAVAVGEALASLAADSQVFVVTHLPQVAALASQHLRVTKEQPNASDEFGEAAVHLLEGTDREEELARMLSGSPESHTAKEHARELLSA